MAKVTYTCFAIPPEGIFIGKVYDTGKDEKGHFYSDGVEKVYCDEEYINTLFSPVEEPKTVDVPKAKEVEVKKSTFKEQKKRK